MRLIDADALEKRMEARLKSLREQFGNYDHYTDGFEEGCVAVEDAETIDPESLRPAGEWIMRGGKLYCTHCGERAAVARDREDFWYTKGTDFCPNCGAKMKGESECSS